MCNVNKSKRVLREKGGHEERKTMKRAIHPDQASFGVAASAHPKAGAQWHSSVGLRNGHRLRLCFRQACCFGNNMTACAHVDIPECEHMRIHAYLYTQQSRHPYPSLLSKPCITEDHLSTREGFSFFFFLLSI